MPRACASFTTSLTGTMVPSAFDICVTATSLVRSVSSFSNSSIRKLPSSSTGAHLMTAPWRSRRKCQGTMLEWCSMIEMMISSPALMLRLAPGRRHEVDRLGGVAGEDDLFGARGVEEFCDLGAAAFIGFGGGVGEVMQPAMHVGVFALVGFRHAVEHGGGLLGGSGVVEIDQRLAIDLHRQRRKILPHPRHVIGAILHRRMHGQPLASSQRCAAAIASSRRPSFTIDSIASPTKAWISSAWASFSDRPRARR